MKQWIKRAVRHPYTPLACAIVDAIAWAVLAVIYWRVLP